MLPCKKKSKPLSKETLKFLLPHAPTFGHSEVSLERNLSEYENSNTDEEMIETDGEEEDDTD